MKPRMLSLLFLFTLTACGGQEDPHAETTEPAVADADDHAEETASDQTLVHLDARERATAGLELAAAGPQVLGQRITLPGEIELDADRLAHIVPRMAGIVRAVRAGLGDQVQAGQVLAILDSRELADAKAEYLAAVENLNQVHALFEREEDLRARGVSSEQEFLDARRERTEARIVLRASRQKLLALGLSEATLDALPERHEAIFTEIALTAPMAGTIIDKHIVLGEALEADAEVFVLADLSRVWAILDVYQKDLALVRAGQRATLRDDTGQVLAAGEIDFVAPMLGEETRTATARVVLGNPDGSLRPGTFVTAVIEAGDETVKVAVPRSALQNLDGENAVFVPVGDAFAPRTVTVGRADGSMVEILTGLRAGEAVVSEGAFSLKAKLVTSGLDPHAGHGH